MYSHTITVINRFSNRGKVEEYFTVISNVHFQDKQGIKTGNAEHFTDNNGYVQIPYVEGNEIIKREYVSDKEYVEPHKWLALDDKGSTWTLQEDDYIVKGEVLETSSKAIPNKRTIDSIENIDYSKFINKHYGVTLK